MSLLLDVYHPKLKWKTETEAVKQSMNAMISMFGGMILIAVLVGAAVLLTLWGWPVSAALGADVVLLALLDAALWIEGGEASLYGEDPLLIVYENIQNNKQNVTKIRAFLAIL